MAEIITRLVPNVVVKIPELLKSIGQTFVMMGISGIISFFIGITLGILLIVTNPKGVYPCKIIWNIVDKTINFFRSIPFIILLAALIPLTRFLVGTAIGVKGAIVPLVFGTVPFFTRQIESALLEIDGGLIEAAESMGNSPLQIVTRVYLREGIPSIVRATTITFISLVGLTAMAGAVGAGGLGDFAIRYGHNLGQQDVTIVTVIILLITVNIIQAIGSVIIKKTTH